MSDPNLLGLSSAWGYRLNDMADLIECSGLSFVRNGSRVYTWRKWCTKLKLEVTEYTSYHAVSKKKEKWFRFETDQASEKTTKRGSSGSSAADVLACTMESSISAILALKCRPNCPEISAKLREELYDNMETHRRSVGSYARCPIGGTVVVGIMYLCHGYYISWIPEHLQVVCEMQGGCITNGRKPYTSSSSSSSSSSLRFMLWTTAWRTPTGLLLRVPLPWRLMLLW